MPQTAPPPAPSPAAAPAAASAETRLIALLAVVAALWWGQRFLIPVVAGLMLAMLVMPLTLRLQASLRSAAVATVLSLALVIGALSAGALAFGGQLLRVAERTPEMISMAAQQLADHDPAVDSLLKRARDALQQLDRAADGLAASDSPPRPSRRTAAAAAAASAATPHNSITAGATVALRETAVTGSGALLGFAGQLGIVFFVAFFVLTGGAPLSERLLGLWAGQPVRQDRAWRTLRECARQIRLYAGVLAVTNTVLGLAVWLAFALAGLPDAAGWGVTAAVLHLVPYLGMALLTGLGAAEAFLAQGSVGAALGMAGFLVLLSTLIGTVVTAWLQARAAKMNPAAVFIGLVFWGALWGVWGLFLGPALVVLLKVLAEQWPAGQALARLMRG